jgi:isopentenyl diphosphate isomerase/L-lactate dehydrogenase-like FMN-dependent dehydrogenase
MGMSRAELEAALASVSKVIARLGNTAAQTTSSIEEFSRYVSDYAKYTGNIVCGANNLAYGVNSIVTGVQHQPIKEDIVTDYHSNPLNEEKKEPMLDTEYTTVYDDLKTDWDDTPISFTDVTNL